MPMIEIKITKEQVSRAESLYDFGELKGSITNGKSNLYGALGEVIVHDYFISIGADSRMEATKDYDLVIDGRTVDVKTKRTTVKPMDHYLCSISCWNVRQKCKYYMFVRIKEDFSVGYILGYKNKNRFFREAKLAKKGDLDVNGWSFKDDCYNMEVKYLDKIGADRN